MCTIGYSRDLNLIFKNRDKPFVAGQNIEEEIVADEHILACRTKGDNYYSWGVNQQGCAFVSAAINTVKWTQLHYDGKQEDADRQFALENEGLESPTKLLSQSLAETQSVEEWITALVKANRQWKGYNLLLVDSEKAYSVEAYRSQLFIKELGERAVITNHYEAIEHGPQREEDYPSSFRRHQYAHELFLEASSTEDVLEILKPTSPERQQKIWRNGCFHTISSSVIQLQPQKVYYADQLGKEYSQISEKFLELSQKPAASGTEHVQKALGPHFEMSRYIDLELYHEVERTHPFYIEMQADVLKQTQAFCKEDRKYRILELGAGTGLLTEELVKLDRLEVVALELDSACCDILKKRFSTEQCEVVHGNAVTFCEPGAFDMVVSSFAHDHIPDDQRYEFAKNIKNNLAPGGIYIMGGEVLPLFHNDESRQEALYAYHGYIVQKALRDQHFAVAQIEINALESGLKRVGDFKRHEAMFEEEMTSSGVQLLVKNKLGPLERDDVGGVYSYVFQNPA